MAKAAISHVVVAAHVTVKLSRVVVVAHVTVKKNSLRAGPCSKSHGVGSSSVLRGCCPDHAQVMAQTFSYAASTAGVLVSSSTPRQLLPE